MAAVTVNVTVTACVRKEGSGLSLVIVVVVWTLVTWTDAVCAIVTAAALAEIV